MTFDQLQSVVSRYLANPEINCEPAKRCNLLSLDNQGPERFGHIHWMLKEMQSFQVEHTEKAMRWLGFVQGALWGLGVFSIEEMKEDNRGAESASDTASVSSQA